MYTYFSHGSHTSARSHKLSHALTGFRLNLSRLNLIYATLTGSSVPSQILTSSHKVWQALAGSLKLSRLQRCKLREGRRKLRHAPKLSQAFASFHKGEMKRKMVKYEIHNTQTEPFTPKQNYNKITDSPHPKAICKSEWILFYLW